MSSIFKNIIKTISLSLIFLGTESSASELYVEKEVTPFTLPSDLTLWQKATNDYMTPVLTTQDLKDKWQILLDFTMPKHGNFNPTDPARRAITIIQSFNKMLDLDEVNRSIYLNNLLERHKIYVTQTH